MVSVEIGYIRTLILMITMGWGGLLTIRVHSRAHAGQGSGAVGQARRGEEINWKAGRSKKVRRLGDVITSEGWGGGAGETAHLLVPEPQSETPRP